jgi:phage terminase large subunit GpA-like protein
MTNTTSVIHNKYHNQDIAFYRAQVAAMPTRQPEKLITKWITGKRIMPSNSPFPGIYDPYKTPYTIEIRDNMSPYSDVSGQAVKKAGQIGATTPVEDCIAYYWKERPRDQMYLSGTEDLYKKFTIKRLGPLMESVGLEAAPQQYSKKGRRTGDTTEIKEYRGGVLTMGSLGSTTPTRSDSVPIMYIDEIDAVDVNMKTGDGNILRVLDVRMATFGERAKSFSLSTPREHANSLIDIQYDRGDKRKFHVPCPRCGKTQWLCMGDEKSNYGLKGDTKAGILEFAYYLCYHCHDAIFESDKMAMLLKGVWLPSIERAPIKNYRSYHLPVFYSTMMNFTAVYQAYMEAIENGDDGMRSFTNLYLGKSFKPSGQRPSYKTVIEIRSKDNSYKSGIVPKDMLFLTTAADIQEGKQKYKKYTNDEIAATVEKIQAKDKESPQLREIPRIEVEVCAHGHNYRTASVIYKTFWGRINDKDSGAWLQLSKWIDETELTFKRKDGFEFHNQMLFVDSGDGKYTDLVYQYCDARSMTYAIKGDKVRKEDKLHMYEIDNPQPGGNVRRVKLSKSGDYSIVLINTNYYKTFIYRNLEKGYGNHADQPGNTHITPCDYPDHYYKQLRAEEKKIDGSFHNRAQARNEALDLLVYNKAAADFFIDGIITADQDVYTRKQKAMRRPTPSKEKLHELANRGTVLNRLEGELRKRGWAA